MDFLYRAFKKDEDARIITSSNGEVFIETIVPILPGAIPVKEEEQEETVSPPLLDIRIQSILFMFGANAFIQFIWLLTSGSLYYWNNSWTDMVDIILLCVSAFLFVLFFSIMIWARKDYPTLAIISLSFWILNGGMMLGAIANITHRMAPTQLTLILMMQSLVVMAYAKLTDTSHKAFHAMAFMMVITLIVWAVFIFAFVEEHDWIGGVVILIISFGTIGYHGWQIQKIDDGRYSLSQDDIRLSIIQFYGDPIISSIL